MLARTLAILMPAISACSAATRVTTRTVWPGLATGVSGVTVSESTGSGLTVGLAVAVGLAVVVGPGVSAAAAGNVPAPAATTAAAPSPAKIGFVADR